MPDSDTEPSGVVAGAPPRRGLQALKENESTRRRAAHALADAREDARSTRPGVSGSGVVGGAYHLTMPRSVPLPSEEPQRAAGSAVLDFVGGTVIKGPAAPAAYDPYSRMYGRFETVALNIMPALYAKGWCSIPQHHRGGRRGPMGGIEYSRFKDHCPTAQMIETWAMQYPDANVAILLGAASHYTFAFDMDSKNPELCRAVRDVLERHFGIDLIRFGAKGFVVLCRTAPDVDVRNRTFHFQKMPDDDPDDAPMLEILGHGSLVTAYGHHHRTGDYFKWGGLQPLQGTPLRAPLVTPEAIEAALANIQRIRPFVGSRKSGSRGCPVDPDGVLAYDDIPEVPGAYMPRLRLDDPRWTAVGERIVDGRRRAMLTHSMGLVAGNGFLIIDDTADEVWPGIVGPAIARLLSTLAPGGARDEGQIRIQYGKMVVSTVQKLRRGEIKPWRLSRAPDGTTVKAARIGAVAETAVRSAALAWLGAPNPGAGVAVRRLLKGAVAPRTIAATCFVEATEAKREVRRLDVDRALERVRVAAETDAAIDAFIISALAGEDVVHALDGPTGSGKSTRTIDRVLPALTADEGDTRPVMIVMPTIANLREAAEVAGRGGAWFEEGDMATELMARMEARATALGIPAVVWKSKAVAGCALADRVALLNEASIGTDRLCESTSEERDEDGKYIKEKCVHFASCMKNGYQAMKAKAKTSRIVFLSHYWLTAPSLPKELSEARAVVIDESVLFRIASTGFLPMSAFDLARPVPFMEKEDRAAMRRLVGARAPESSLYDRWAGHTSAMRYLAASLAKQGIAERWDLVRLAEAFAAEPVGPDNVRMQVRICTDAMSHGALVWANIGIEDVRRLCKESKPLHLALERRFWITVRELVDQLVADAKREPGEPWKARRNEDGTLRRDTRLQAIEQPVAKGFEWGYRISWRSGVNWPFAPTLLLDASADPDIVRRLWPARRVVHHHVEASLNLRTVLIADETYSGSSLDPRPRGDDGDAVRAEKARSRRVKLRRLIELVSSAHGHGRVLFGAAKAVREALTTWWPHPPWNLDEVHYGAQRGLDFAKDHAAAISIGRSEMPVWLVDGLAAALTWDMDEPEGPYDRRGNGLTDRGTPLLRRGTTRMVGRRDGSDVGLVVPMAEGTYGRKIDQQWRDEELSQFRGRLRPVYRDEPATWICVSSVFPEGVVADEILTLDEALATWSPVMSVLSHSDVMGVVAAGLTDRRDDVSAEDVRAFLVAHADDPAYRDVTWTDDDGTDRRGLVWAAQDSPGLAIGTMLDVPKAMRRATIGPLKRSFVASRIRPPDALAKARPSSTERQAREAEFRARWDAEAAGNEALREAGYAIAAIGHEMEAPPPLPPPPKPPAVPEPKTPERRSETTFEADWEAAWESAEVRSWTGPDPEPNPGTPVWRVSPAHGIPPPC